VVSVEDIVEEVVGEIDDETDPQHRHAVPDGERCWLIDGQVALRDLLDDGFSLPEPAGTYATLAGLLLHRAGRLPDEGETVSFDDWQATVTRRDGSRIARVRLAAA
jgi:CBS domain containing-hemolysin-like protein